jgi:pyruvate,orthophosphate dikinase
MFFDPQRIQNVREMIFAESEEERRNALTQLLPAQRSDFIELFTIMKGLPVTVRLLDPPYTSFYLMSQQRLRSLSNSLVIPKKEFVAVWPN